MINVLIDHNDSLLATGVAATLERSGDFRIMQSRPDAACSPLDSSREADIVVADYDTALRLMRGACRRSAILVLARYASESQIRLAIEQGVSGYLLIGCSSNELLSSVHALSRGRKVFSGPVAAKMAESIRYRPLTRRELVVLSYVAKGCSNKDIGNRLGLSEGTIKTHVKSILAKLHVHSRTEAAATAARRGLFPEER